MTLQELQEQALKLSIEERWQLIWVVLRLRQRSVSLQPHPQSAPKQKGLAASLIGIAKTDAPGIARVLQLSAIIRGLAARLCQCL